MIIFYADFCPYHCHAAAWSDWDLYYSSTYVIFAELVLSSAELKDKPVHLIILFALLFFPYYTLRLSPCNFMAFKLCVLTYNCNKRIWNEITQVFPLFTKGWSYLLNTFVFHNFAKMNTFSSNCYGVVDPCSTQTGQSRAVLWAQTRKTFSLNF